MHIDFVEENFVMALATCSVMFFLFCIAFQVNPADSKCKKSFECGDLGRLEFPLSDNDCGLFTLNCTTSPPLFQMGGADRPWVKVRNKTATNRFRVIDPFLGDMLAQNNCFSFGAAIIDDSPISSLAIYPNISLLSCLKHHQSHLNEYFKTYSRCDAMDLYYNYKGPPYPSPMEESNLPKNCSIIRMPTAVELNQSTDDLFKLFSSEFELEWHVSADCLSCHNNGGTCLIDSKNEFLCKENERNTVILVSAICASVVFLGLCIVVSILLYRCKRKTKDTYLLSRNISSGAPSKSELEFGGRFYYGIPIFSYQELEEATCNFDPSKELGDGGFGTIYYGKLQDGREVAIKRLYEHNCNRVEQFMNEVNILTCLRHPNLVTLYGCTSRRSQELLLVYEYIPNGTVADHLHGEISHRLLLTWPLRMSIAVETAAALAYLHRSDIIHRDVKTSNILLDKNFCVKVADFGLSKLLPNNATHILTSPQGTPGYVDPEYHQCYQLTDKSDVYSFGVVLIELISSMPAVDMTRDKHEINLANLALDRIQRCAFDEIIDSSLGYPSDAEVTRTTTLVAELAFQCLQLEQNLRPSMEEVLTFLKDIQAGACFHLQKEKRGNGKYWVVEKVITSSETDAWPSVGCSTTTSSMA